MKIEHKENNVIEWEDGMCMYTIPDIKKYINALKTFSSYETNKNKLTIVEHQAIAQEIQAWEGIIGLISRINIGNKKNNNN